MKATNSNIIPKLGSPFTLSSHKTATSSYRLQGSLVCSWKLIRKSVEWSGSEPCLGEVARILDRYKIGQNRSLVKILGVVSVEYHSCGQYLGYQHCRYQYLSCHWLSTFGNIFLMPSYKSLIEKMVKSKTRCANLLMIFLINSLIFTTFPSQSLASSSVDFVRPPARSVVVTPHNRSASDPQQVHVSLVGKDQMRITWITQGMAPSIVEYGTNLGEYDTFAKGDHKTYHYFMYSSGRIHNVVIGPLKPNTTYYYRCSNKAPQFSLRTPPPSFPIEFAIVGDLGQTEWTKSTLEHVGQRDYDVFLLPGDLSYADTQQPLWDSFGRLVEPYASQRPWMVTQGNHEVEFIPFVSDSFRAYNARWGMPYEESGSTSNLYYSFDVHGAHIIMLGSYTDYDVDSAQYTWLRNDLTKIDRSKTPWIIVLLHAPWYNSNTAHKGEGESMRRAMEDLLYNAKVDVVFAGHVHAYERFTRVYNNQVNPCGPLYITIGDGGNREGLALMFENPAPSISMYREPSFGHGRLRLLDGKKAHWSWYRNKDSNATTFADEVWLENLSTSSSCSSNGSKFSHDEF